METPDNRPSRAEAAGRVAGRWIAAARAAFGNKPLSSAIIVVAAAILIAGGGHIQHADTRLFVMAVGGVVGVVGLLVWLVSTEAPQ